MTSHTHLDTIIIGAGISGIIIAERLIKSNQQILILEQQSDVGGTWQIKKCYANLKTHAPRSSFSNIRWNDDEELDEKAPCSSVYDALQQKSKQLTNYIQFNSRVVAIEHTNDLIKVSTPSKIFESKYLIYTGSTFKPYIPVTPQHTYNGEVLASEQMTDRKVAEIVEKNLSVVVVGGSKAANDHVWNFYNTHSSDKLTWVARKTYWFTNYKIFNSWYNKLLSMLQYKMLLDYDKGSYNITSSTLFKFLVSQKVFLNVFQDESSFSYHGGITEEMQLDDIKNVNFQQGEIKLLYGNKALLTNGKLVDADIVLYCTGYTPDRLPIRIIRNGTVEMLNPLSLTHENLVRGLVNPKCPRILFANPVSLGDITRDAELIANWFLVCSVYLNESSTTDSLTFQNNLFARIKCRPFNLWNPFDRPIPYSVAMKRMLRKDTELNRLVDKNRTNIYVVDGIVYAAEYLPHVECILTVLFMTVLFATIYKSKTGANKSYRW